MVASSRDLRRSFGQRLRNLRKSVGLTQAKLGELAGVSEDLISLIERGVSAPSFETIASLADTLQVQACSLFDFEDLDAT